MARAKGLAPLLVGAVLIGSAFGLAGCAGPVGLYHNAEGGAIARTREPPPGVDMPYPNLAAVPPAPVGLSTAQTAVVVARLGPMPTVAPPMQANPAALAGLELPGGPPPAADIAGISEPAAPTPHVIVPPAPPPAPPTAAMRDSVPVALAFSPGSAVLDGDTVQALTALAEARGDADILAGGFGGGQDGPDAAALTLALARARAVADALTAAGVPAGNVLMVAAAVGSGGFAQLVY